MRWASSLAHLGGDEEDIPESVLSKIERGYARSLREVKQYYTACYLLCMYFFQAWVAVLVMVDPDTPASRLVHPTNLLVFGYATMIFHGNDPLSEAIRGLLYKGVRWIKRVVMASLAPLVAVLWKCLLRVLRVIKGVVMALALLVAVVRKHWFTGFQWMLSGSHFSLSG